MALYDVLPMFQMSPFKIPETKLIPRDNNITPVEIKNIGRVAPVNQTLAPGPAPAPSQLPEKYKAYAPVDNALKASSIVNPQARMAVIAQMGLESGWKVPQDFNYGNITTGEAWNGPSTIKPDKDAKGNPITQAFRTYKSPEHFVDDYVSLLKKQYPSAHKELTSPDFDVHKFTSGLQDGNFKYAEDPKYKQKIEGIYNEISSSISRNKQ